MNKELISSDYDFSDMLVQEGMYLRSTKLYGLHTLNSVEKIMGKAVHGVELLMRDLKKVTSKDTFSFRKISSENRVMITSSLLVASVSVVIIWTSLLLS